MYGGPQYPQQPQYPQHPHQAPQGPYRQPPAPPKKRDPEATQRAVGKVLYWVGMFGGLWLLVQMFLLPPMFSRDPGLEYGSMLVGFLLAMPPLVIYLFIPWIVDRYDPEPLWALMMVLSWGAIAACGFSALVNTQIQVGVTQLSGSREFGSAVGACLSAPFIEEITKGIAVFFMFYAFRREFDGVVDGIIYGCFAALGFAAVENVIYYSRAVKTEMITNREGILAGTFVVRGILAPWGHPLYTAMTGIGFGVARETHKGWLKWVAPLAGLSAAMFLHSVWNTAATISNTAVFLMLPLWFIFVFAFFCMVVYLVRRKGKIIRKHLEDEVLMGMLTVPELDLVTSPINWWKTGSWGGAPARKFVEAAARLSLSKWHAGRASRSRKLTVSADFVVPLRQDLAKYRAEMSRALGRQLPQPQAWTPGSPPPFKPTK